MRNLAAGFMAAALLAGCGGGSSDGGSVTTLRCLFVDDICQEITAVMTASQQATLGTSCTNGGGAYAVGNCPTAGAVAGHCYYTGTTVLGGAIAGATANEYYYSAGWTLTDAQTYCALPPAGTWVP